MIKRLLLALAVLLCLAPLAFAEQTAKTTEKSATPAVKTAAASPGAALQAVWLKGLYAGVQASYALEMLDISNLSKLVKDEEYDVDFKDAIGGGLRFGYQINKIFSADVCMEYLPKFSYEGKAAYKGATPNVNIDMDILTCIFAVKMHPPMGEQTTFRPYILAGGGLMVVDLSMDGKNSKGHTSYTNSEDHPCGKAAAGLDYYLMDDLSLGFEGAYIWGFNECDEIKYVDISVNVCKHF